MFIQLQDKRLDLSNISDEDCFKFSSALFNDKKKMLPFNRLCHETLLYDLVPIYISMYIYAHTHPWAYFETFWIPLNLRKHDLCRCFVHVLNLCHHLTEAHDNQPNREVVTKTLLLSCDVASNFQLLSWENFGDVQDLQLHIGSCAISAKSNQ